MSNVFRFGRCELRVASRELRRDGQLQALPPKAFDLLVHLLRRQDQVVTKAALLDALWPGADISENMLARTVMKVRHALGDDGEAPQWLCTVHRVGYRLRAPGPDAVAAEVTVADPPRQRPMRLALLPVDNLSGDPQFDWIAWGLPTLVGQALHADDRLAVLDNSTVGHALSLTSADTAALLGVNCQVQASVRRQGDRWRLDYQARGERDFQGSLRGGELTALGQALAEAIEAGLFPDARSPVRMQSNDPLACQAYARALDLSNREQWGQAARLLRVVIDLAPDDRFAKLHYLRMLANLHDPQADAVGEALLAEAARTDDQRLLAATHEALGRALFNRGGDAEVVRARGHMDTALALAQPYADEDWVVRIHLGQAIVAHMQRDFVRAQRDYRLAWQGNERVGNQMRRAVILNNWGLVEASLGNLLVAGDMAEQSLAVCQRHGLKGNAVDAQSNLALIDAGLGLYRRAVAHCEAAMSGLAALPAHEQSTVAWVLLLAGELALEARQPSLAARADAAAGPQGDDIMRRADAALAVARAYRAALAGDTAEMSTAMRGAVDASLALGDVDNAHQFLRRWLGMCLHLHALTHLPSLLAEIRALPRWGDDLELQAACARADAACQLARRQPGPARASLAQALELAPSGQVAGLVRLDLADLWVLDGQPEAARRLMRGQGSWLRDHPAGPALQTRLEAPDAGPQPAPERLLTVRQGSV